MEQELTKIDILYQEIIEETKKFLTQKWVNTNPIGVYAFLSYMISFGVFTNYPERLKCSSIPESLKEIESRYFDLSQSGKLLFSGYSLCRHISNFAYRVYESLNYQSSQLFIYMMPLSFEFVSKKDISLERKQAIIDELYQEFLKKNPESFNNMSLEDEDYVIKCSYIKCSNTINRIGNHTFNIVLTKENQNLLLDLSTLKVGEKTDNKNIINMYSENGIYVPFYVKKRLNYDKDYTNMEFSNALSLLKSYKSVPNKEVWKQIVCFLKECQKRQKEFQCFHDKNSKIYDELTEQVNQLIKKVL